MTALAAASSADLFFPELVAGPRALSSEQRTALEDYFAAVASRRHFPVHTAVLWNALAWGFDLESGSYPEAPVDELVVVSHGALVDAVPIGAFVKVPFGGTDLSGHDEFWGEVVYKEGRGPDLESAWIPGALSGAPAQLTTDENGLSSATLREALIIDFDAILEAQPHDLQRQSERGKCIDLRHHVIVDAVYGTRSGRGGSAYSHADLDDATYFAHWMVTHHADTLRQGPFGAGLDPDALADDTVLREALVSCLVSIEEIASGVPGCRSWRGYVFDVADYEQRVADTENALGGADMEYLARGLGSVPRGESVVYVGLGTRVVEEFGNDAELHGPGWATVICHQSTFTIDWLAQSAGDGVLTTASGPVHLRLDDPWQAGGVWRAQLLGGLADPICSLPPDMALGLGYAEATGQHLEWPDLGQETEDLEPEPEVIETAATEIGARVVLTGTDIDAGRLRLPFPFAEAVERTLSELGQSSLVVRLTVEDYELEEFERPHWATPARFVPGSDAGEKPGVLFGVDWPWPFVAGLRAEVVWTRGTRVIDVTARLRFEPLVFGEMVFAWDCDEVLYARACGVQPPLVTTRARTLRDLVLGVFRTKARPDVDGRCRASLPQLSFAVYGPGASIGARRAVQVVVSTLCVEGVLGEEIGGSQEPVYVWAPVVQPGNRVTDRDTIAAYQEHMARHVREHEVGLHLRRLTVSEVATRYREAQYRSEWAAAGCPWWLPPDLPHGYTFVRQHVRGG